MIVELHLLQSVPATELGRDEGEGPRRATFGNVAREQLPSRYLRRSARALLAEQDLALASAGVSTRRLIADAGRWIDAASCADDPGADTGDLVREAFYELGLGLASGELTPSVAFTADRAGERLARFCLENREDYADRATRRKKIIANAADPEQARQDELALANVKTAAQQREAAERVLAPRQAIDVALFGGTISDEDEFTAEPACEVADALSTHAAGTTAESAELAAACYYRYARLDLAKLTANLGGDRAQAERAAHGWLRALVRAVPDARPNETAARTLPEVVFAVVREHGSWNLVNAFLDPIAGADPLAGSARRLVEYFGQVRAFYDTGEIREVLGASVTGELPLERTRQPATLDDLATRAITAALG
ncbi:MULTISPECIES: type I-E CRISPR-associated protein Cas7/Cse4/CasC [unclassified Saccharopolyspora]|uniref:type I-E CRISPR-associated protein Cas7/Cse4/CasC n=1 Tax=unclassified Saccharopolyspora TaxID=2646250 RepID=UPI001CD569A3|nr:MULTISPECIES: type I-E CRISPR-associated protein Cas7/Cse4/CasC [unclassified Saccharopolyspora]MCA1188288.1 type I-E CRISPR-associated protein Cas7/Cse4/CasC [Saccharopolyspora sp. 6T]MCA1193502.1 type I-E CRISPR-associated protein Cas7/Cse4/CasC [Saccharopolyspora sp. 6V]MCA1280503.1 type I-E CRISPR-associated protein Cas7/Cse4/CasC [Saccharopolyspora sp. 7B]